MNFLQAEDEIDKNHYHDRIEFGDLSGLSKKESDTLFKYLSTKCKKLEKLSIDKIGKIPPLLLRLKDLTSVSFKENTLQEIMTFDFLSESKSRIRWKEGSFCFAEKELKLDNDCLFDYSYRDWVRLFGCAAKKFPDLKKIHISSFGIKKLPTNIGNFTALQHLVVSRAHSTLSALPKEIENCKALETIDLSCNKFTEIPGVLLKLENLKQLTMRNNAIRKVPASFFDKFREKELDLRGNKITDLPIELCLKFLNSKKIQFANNPIKKSTLLFFCVKSRMEGFKGVDFYLSKKDELTQFEEKPYGKDAKHEVRQLVNKIDQIFVQYIQDLEKEFDIDLRYFILKDQVNDRVKYQVIKPDTLTVSQQDRNAIAKSWKIPNNQGNKKAISSKASRGFLPKCFDPVGNVVWQTLHLLYLALLDVKLGGLERTYNKLYPVFRNKVGRVIDPDLRSVRQSSKQENISCLQKSTSPSQRKSLR